MDILEQAKKLASNMPKPKPTLTSIELKSFGLDGITFLAKVSVSNPYAIPIPIGEIVYTVKSLGNLIGSGSIPDPGSLKGDDNTILDVTVKVPYNVVISLVQDISGDWDIDYVVELGIIMDFPVIGNITIPISHTGQVKLPTISEFLMGKPQPVEQELEK